MHPWGDATTAGSAGEAPLPAACWELLASAVQPPSLSASTAGAGGAASSGPRPAKLGAHRHLQQGVNQPGQQVLVSKRREEDGYCSAAELLSKEDSLASIRQSKPTAGTVPTRGNKRESA